MQLYQAILEGNIQFPRFVSKQAKDLISKLLQADLSRRLGNLRNGSLDVRRHPFFKGFDWNALIRREMKPPIDIGASISSEDDTSFFDDYGDEELPNAGPVSSQEDKLFAGF
jgi:serine/threonine protein kinase